MDVELWADPACAWSWAAYLWLDSVASDKDLTITIHPFSLEIRGRWRGEEVSPLLSAAGGAPSFDTDPAHQRIPVTVLGLDGSRRGLVGPLLDPVPDRATAMRLWDAVITLASESCFREFSQPVARHSLTFPAH